MSILVRINCLSSLFSDLYSVPVAEAADPPQVSAAEEAPAPLPQPGVGNSKGTENLCCTHSSGEARD